MFAVVCLWILDEIVLARFPITFSHNENRRKRFVPLDVGHFDRRTVFDLVPREPEMDFFLGRVDLLDRKSVV